MKEYLHEIIHLLGADKRRIPWLIVLFFVSSTIDLAGLGLVVPYVGILFNGSEALAGINQFLSVFSLSFDRSSLIVYIGFALVLVFLVKAVLGIWINKIIIKFGLNQQLRLRKALMHSYQSMPYELYIGRNSANYIHNLTVLTGAFALNVVTPLLRLTSDGAVALVIVLYLSWTNGIEMALLVGIFAASLLFYDRVYRRRLRDMGVNSNIASAEIVKGIREGIGGLKEIRVLGNERYFYNRVKAGAERYADYGLAGAVIGMVPRYIFELMLIIFIVTLVFLSLKAGEGPAELAPALAVFGVASLRLMPMINITAQALANLRFHRDAVSRLYSDCKNVNLDLDEQAARQASRQPQKFETFGLDQVRFTYQGQQKPALDEINIQIRRGENIGFIGTSGAGKTTLIDLMLGLLKPDSGQLMYNGGPLPPEQLDVWRSQIAYLPQEIFLVDDSLRRNVALGVDAAEIDEELLWSALRQASLEDLVTELPEGLDTEVGENGVRLSGGQRQRVALARAFYHQRNVLILDEATSALDNETESEIVSQVNRLKGDKTFIVIAHRLTTIAHCDRVYRLENGRVVGVGTPEEMVS